MKAFLIKHQLFFVLLGITLISVLVTGYFYTTDQILLYNDARSHMDISRRVVDSLTPGLMQIGSVWLPLYQILLLPIISNDFLWKTGLAGSIISGIAYIIGTFFIWKTVKLITNSFIVTLFVTGIFALNPNLLYLQSAPLDATIAVGTAAGSLYFLFKWSKSNQILDLIFAAMFALLGSLARYEVWFLLVAELAYVFIKTFLESDAKEKLLEKLKKAEGITLLFAFLAFFGMLLWFLYNFLGWNDALYFLHNPSAHLAQQHEFEIRGLLPTKHNLSLSTYVLITNILENIGPALMVAATASLVLLMVKRETLQKKLLYLLGFAPLGFILLTLFMGVTVLFTRLFPFPGTDRVFNVRYGVIALIPAVLVLAYALTQLNLTKRLGTLCAVLLLSGIIIIDSLFFIQTAPIAAISDGKTGISAFGQTDEHITSKIITENCAGGLTLISAGNNEILMFESGFPMKSFIYEGSGKYWKQAIRDPKSIANCIVFSPADQVAKNLPAEKYWVSDYTLIFTSMDHIKIYKRGTLKKNDPVTKACVDYDVQTGDSLWKIAKKTLGSGALYKDIMALNAANFTQDSIISPSQKLLMPCSLS